jgi:hypothetical protein
MNNELEKEARALWRDYAPQESFWQAYRQLIIIAKNQSQPVDIAPYQERQHLAYQNLLETSHYNLLVAAPIRLGKAFANSLILPSVITVIGFMPLATVMGFSLAYLTLCFKAFALVFLLTFFITLFDDYRMRECVFTLQFYEDRLVYVNHQEKKLEVLYVNIDKLSWRYNGKMVLTEQNKKRHTLYYPITSKPQSLAIRNLLEAIVQHNAILKQ